MKKYKMIIEFLKIIDADREAKRFMRLFSRGNPVHFAVIKVGGAVIENSLKMVAVDLAYLSNLDLFPVVIHGGGRQIDRALQEAELAYIRRGGLRVTTEEQLPIIKKVLDRINEELVEGIKSYGGCAVGLTENIFMARKCGDDALGYVGEVERINLEKVTHVIKDKKIPVIASIGYANNGHYYNINADEAAKAMVLAVRPKKYIILTDEGGIKNKDGEVITNICLDDEFMKLESNGIITGGMLLKVKEAKDLLSKINYSLPIQITSGDHLLKELFTYKGKGTFIKLGSNIEEHCSWNGLNRDRIKKLVWKSFGRRLLDWYFELPTDSIIIERLYKGMAVVRLVEGMYYLDKFCVSEEAQGQGIGQDIWNHLIDKYHCLFWRSRRENPVNIWYFQKADGCVRVGKWVMFWINLNEDQVKEAIKYVSNLEETLY